MENSGNFYYEIIGSKLILGNIDIYDSQNSFDQEFDLENKVQKENLFEIKNGNKDERLEISCNCIRFFTPNKICYIPENGLYNKLLDYQKSLKASA